MNDTKQSGHVEETEDAKPLPARRWLMPGIIGAALILGLAFAFAIPRDWVMAPEEPERSARNDGAEAEKNPKEFYA